MFPLVRVASACAVAACVLTACDRLKLLFGPKLPPPPPVTAQVYKVRTMDVPMSKQWVGTMTGYQNADILAKVPGYLIKQDYVEGSFVKAGAVLFEIDPRPFQATLEQAKAQYAQSYAQAQLAQVTLHRQTQLVKTNVISQQQYDNSYQSTQAALANASAAKANLDTAQLNLQFCTIVAPFDGIVGIAQAQIGSLVGTTGSNAVLTQMSQVDPIKIIFPISEQEYLQASGYINTYAALPAENRPPLFELILSNGEVYPYKGTFDFANRQVDPNTGTIQIVGLFPNPNNILRPGQYAMIQARVADLKNAIVVPQIAVAQIQGTYQLTLLNPDNTISIRTVEVGPTYGPWWIIKKGLRPGETVIVKITKPAQLGMKVVPTPYPLPSTPPTETPRPFFSPSLH